MSVLTTNEQMVRWNRVQLRAALRLYLATGILPTNGARMRDLLKRAGWHTGRVYMNSRRSCSIAIADLTKILES